MYFLHNSKGTFILQGKIKIQKGTRTSSPFGTQNYFVICRQRDIRNRLLKQSLTFCLSEKIEAEKIFELKR